MKKSKTQKQIDGEFNWLKIGKQTYRFYNTI